MNRDVSAENKRIADNIREYGWHCLHVFPTKEGQEKFSYSIGFEASFGGPEVLIFGLEQEKAHALLNECAQLLKNGHVIRPDIEDDNVLSGGYNVVFKSVRSDHYGEYLGTALRFYQERPFNAMVMFVPDRQHRFPWHEGYDHIPAKEAMSIV